MAVPNRKFRVWIALSVAFIPLNVLANPVQQLEGHQCYWCGPLAEQVHRSQRAAKCNGDKSKVTICDEDFPYCAIVASSPPYAESRYCVKFYQDECYPLYCNTTKIWKVICPCQGELCNGPNTKRENEVFEALHKLTQTKRLRRAIISSAGFFGITTRRNKVDNVTIEQNIDSLNDDVKNKESDNAANSIIESIDSQKSSSDKISEMEVTPIHSETFTPEHTSNLNSVTSTSEMLPNDIAENVKVKNLETEGVAKIPAEKDSTESIPIDSNRAQTTLEESAAVETTSASSYTGYDTNIKEEPAPQNTNPTIGTPDGMEVNDENCKNQPNLQINIPGANINSDDLKTDIIVMSSDKPNTEKDTTVSSDTDIKVSITPKSTTSTKSTEMSETNTGTESKLEKGKSNENLPSAEALQHTDTTSKITEPMYTTSTTSMSINTNMEQTTQTTMLRNNTAVRIDAHIITVVIGLLFQY